MLTWKKIGWVLLHKEYWLMVEMMMIENESGKILGRMNRQTLKQHFV